MKDRMAEFFIETANAMKDIGIILLKLLCLAAIVAIVILIIALWVDGDMFWLLRIVVSAIGLSVSFILFCLADNL